MYNTCNPYYLCRRPISLTINLTIVNVFLQHVLLYTALFRGTGRSMNGNEAKAMKTVMIIGNDNLMYTAADLINPKEMKLIGFGDTRESSWNVLDEKGDVKEEITGMPVMPIDLVPSLNPDLIVIAAIDETRNNALKYMIFRAGFIGDVVFLYDLHEQFSIRVAMLRRLAYRLDFLGVEGAAAELGCYRGDTSWQLNALMPERKLYLFDTFEGFDPRDIEKERELGCSKAEVSQFRYDNIDRLLGRMPAPDQVVIKKGWFPETALELEDEKFALVHMDACLYEPTRTGLEFFFPRMSRGGVLILCGYEDDTYAGVRKAVEDLEDKYGAFLSLPSGDLTGTVMIIHP